MDRVPQSVVRTEDLTLLFAVHRASNGVFPSLLDLTPRGRSYRDGAVACIVCNPDPESDVRSSVCEGCAVERVVGRDPISFLLNTDPPHVFASDTDYAHQGRGPLPKFVSTEGVLEVVGYMESWWNEDDPEPQSIFKVRSSQMQQA
jgi:hypothetical protein